MTAERVRIREASLITGLDIRTLQEKAARGEIPGAEKPFGRWTFDIAQLRGDYIHCKHGESVR